MVGLTPHRQRHTAQPPTLLPVVLCGGPAPPSHRRAVTAANKKLLRSYWSIGREILNRQSEEGWGSSVIDRLSTDLKSRFPGATGYSPRNLRYMRTFAGAWPANAILQAPLAELPWYHQLALMSKLDEPQLRLWYASAAVERGWSRDVLALHIDARFHERAGKAITNFAAALPAGDSDLAQQATRDPYLFDFLGTTDGWQGDSKRRSVWPSGPTRSTTLCPRSSNPLSRARQSSKQSSPCRTSKPDHITPPRH